MISDLNNYTYSGNNPHSAGRNITVDLLVDDVLLQALETLAKEKSISVEDYIQEELETLLSFS